VTRMEIGENTLMAVNAGPIGRLPQSLIAALLAIPAAIVIGAPAGLMSTWRTSPVTIDGITDEWSKLETMDGGPAVAVMNDRDSLYLAVMTNDRKVRGLLATGLILWFDASGGKAQTLGLRISGTEAPLLPGMTERPASNSSAAGLSSDVLDRFDLLGPGKSQRRLVDLKDAPGVELAIGSDSDTIAYEVKVPLASAPGRVFAVGAKSGATIGLGVATPEAPRERNKGPLVGSDNGFIGGSPYGAGANGGGFAAYAEPDGRVKPLNLWTTVKLADGGKP
jgi:hypothetical protein